MTTYVSTVPDPECSSHGPMQQWGEVCARLSEEVHFHKELWLCWVPTCRAYAIAECFITAYTFN